jgi:hypothetical protein
MFDEDRHATKLRTVAFFDYAVGMKASGHALWFERLLYELRFYVSNPFEIPNSPTPPFIDLPTLPP